MLSITRNTWICPAARGESRPITSPVTGDSSGSSSIETNSTRPGSSPVSFGQLAAPTTIPSTASVKRIVPYAVALPEFARKSWMNELPVAEGEGEQQTELVQQPPEEWTTKQAGHDADRVDGLVWSV